MDEHEEDLETLGEQLYAAIYSKHKEDAGKLTGEETCLITVQWGKLAWEPKGCYATFYGCTLNVNMFTVLVRFCYWFLNVTFQSVFFVCLFCPNTCVLGMLLELPVPVITRILQDEAVLTAAVDKAFGALQVAQESRFCNTHLLSRLMSLSQHH